MVRSKEFADQSKNKENLADQIKRFGYIECNALITIFIVRLINEGGGGAFVMYCDFAH